MKTRNKPSVKPLSLRVETLENRALLSASPWSAPVDSLDAPIVESASAQLEKPVVDLSNAQLENSVSFVNTGVTDNQYSLSWKPIDGASTYSVKINRDGKWIQYNKGLTETSCVMNGLYPGKTYDIRVCAINAKGRLTGDYLQTTFAPVSLATKMNKFVGGDAITLTLKASDDATYDIAWYYATPNGDVEITEARGLLTYVPENPQYDVKVVATGTGLSEGSLSEKLIVYAAPETVDTTYDSAANTLTVNVPAVDGAVKYYIWKPAPSGNMAIYQRTTEPVFTVSNVKPGTTCDYQVTAYDAKGTVLNALSFKYAPVSLETKMNKFVDGEEITLTIKASVDATYDIAWYYVTPDGDVEITEAHGRLTYVPENPQYDVKVVATGTGLSKGSLSEKLIVYVAPETVDTTYDSKANTLTVVAPVVEGAVKYYIWKPAPSGNMAIYQRTTEPVFTVSNVKPGTTCDYQVTAYDAKGTVLDALSFTFAPVGLNAPEYFKSGDTISVEIVEFQKDSADLAWFYVTPKGDVKIPEAANQTSFTPANLDYPVKIVATGTGLSEGSVAEAIVKPVALNVAPAGAYQTAARRFDVKWNAVPGAAQYVFQRKNADGNWATMTESNVVDGAVVSGDVRTTDGSSFEYTVNMSDASVSKEYRVLALDANGETILSETFEYTPVGLAVDNDAYPLDRDSLLVARPLNDADAKALSYQWYSATAENPDSWTLIEGATGLNYQLTSESAALGLYYKVVATDPAAEDRISVAYARPDTLTAPLNFVVDVDDSTGELVATWKGQGATEFVLQYAYDGPAAYAWLDLPAPTVVDNGDGSFTLKHPNGANYKNLRARAVNETGWTDFTVARNVYELRPVEEARLCVNTTLDVVDPDDGVTSLREAISYYIEQQWMIGINGEKISFDPNVFTRENHTIVLDPETTFDFNVNIAVDATALGFNVILDATNSQQPVFNISGLDVNVEFAGLTLMNYHTDFGDAAIRVSDFSILTLSSCRIANMSGHSGSAIKMDQATLYANNSSFDTNDAMIAGVIYAQNDSHVDVVNSIFRGNIGHNHTGAVELENTYGTFTNCYFLNNKATYLASAVRILENSYIDFDRCKFSMNVCNSANGQAIYIGLGSVISLVDVEFDGNTPADTGGEGRIWGSDNSSTLNASAAILESDVELLDDAFIDLEDEIELFF